MKKTFELKNSEVFSKTAMIKMAKRTYNQLSQPSRIRAVIFSSGGSNAHQKPNLVDAQNPVWGNTTGVDIFSAGLA